MHGWQGLFYMKRICIGKFFTRLMDLVIILTFINELYEGKRERGIKKKKEEKDGRQKNVWKKTKHLTSQQTNTQQQNKQEWDQPFFFFCTHLGYAFSVQDSDSSRGFRGRSTYRSYRSSTRVRVRQRVRNTYVGSRIRRGSSMFSSNTWKAAVLAGAIYGGTRYLSSPYYRRYPNRSKYSTLLWNDSTISYVM